MGRKSGEGINQDVKSGKRMIYLGDKKYLGTWADQATVEVYLGDLWVESLEGR